MVAVRFKHRLKPLCQNFFFCVRHPHENFQSSKQSVCGLRLRQPAIKGITEIDLIQTQDIVEYVRYFKRSVFTVFKNRDIRRKNIFEFLVIAHIRNGASNVSVQKKLTDLHILPLLRKFIFVLPI